MKRGPSKKQRARIKVRQATRLQLLVHAKGCAVALLGGPGRCNGGLTHHHVKPSGRGGADGLENAAAVCAEHNRLLSQDAETMKWGYEHGLLKHGWEN